MMGIRGDVQLKENKRKIHLSRNYDNTFVRYIISGGRSYHEEGDV